MIFDAYHRMRAYVTSWAVPNLLFRLFIQQEYHRDGYGVWVIDSTGTGM